MARRISGIAGPTSRRCATSSHVSSQLVEQSFSRPTSEQQDAMDTKTDNYGTLIEGRTGPREIILGLEVHAQVISEAKLFSGAATSFGAEPNSQVSLVDAAFPGMLPVINQRCIDQAVKKIGRA